MKSEQSMLMVYCIAPASSDSLISVSEKTPLTSKVFRLTLTKNTEVRFCIPVASKLLPLPDNYKPNDEFPTPPDVGFTEEELDAERKGMAEGGETAGFQRLQYYTFETEQLTGYYWSCNRSLGMNHSSKFSSWMASGCLSPRYIY